MSLAALSFALVALAVVVMSAIAWYVVAASMKDRQRPEDSGGDPGP